MQKLLQNKLLLTIVAGVAVVAFLFASYFLTSGSQQTYFANINKVTAADHVKWSRDKKTILTEYSDFQCPACKSFHEYIKQEVEATKSGKVDVTKKMTFVYRHFPLVTLHQHALEAAYAAEAAAKQGAFFAFADMLFDKQDEWSKTGDTKNYFVGMAKGLELDVDRFEKDMNSQEVKDRVQADQVIGAEAGINATPTFFLNGRKIDIQSFEQFKQLLVDTATKSE